MSKALIVDSRFGPFFWTQFLGAFNDNLLKFAVTLAITYSEVLRGDAPAGLLINLVAGFFILPFFLFSATSGLISDTHDKTRVMQLAKLLEIPIVLLTAAGFYFNSVWLLIGAVFLLGSQSSFFGPAKYAFLPQHLGMGELVAANAMVQSGTFVAILLGTIAAGTLLSQEVTQVAVYATCGLGLTAALVGLLVSLKIPLSPPTGGVRKVDWDILRSTFQNIENAKKQELVWPNLLGISWLWFLGATYLTQFPLLAKDVFYASPGVATFLLFLFTVGLALGAFICTRYSRGRLESGFSFFGLIGMLIAGGLLQVALLEYSTPSAPVELQAFLAQAYNWGVVFLFVMISLFTGLFSVPLYAGIQALTQPSQRSQVIAANNIVNSLFMVVSAIAALVILILSGQEVRWVLAFVCGLNLLVVLLWIRFQRFSVLRGIALLKLGRKQFSSLEDYELLLSPGGKLFVFPTLLHEDMLPRLISLPVPVSIVLSGRAKNTWLVRWLRKSGFIHELKGLAEEAGQKALLNQIAKEMQAGGFLGIDMAMYKLLTGRFKLDQLPLALAKRGVIMSIFQVQEIVDPPDEISFRKIRLTSMG